MYARWFRRRQGQPGPGHSTGAGPRPRLGGGNAVRETGTRPWDPAEHLETAEDMVAYLEAALQETPSSAAVLGDIARAKGMSRPGGRTGKRKPLRVLSTSGNPEFATILKVVRALGLTAQRQRRLPAPSTSSWLGAIRAAIFIAAPLKPGMSRSVSASPIDRCLACRGASASCSRSGPPSSASWPPSSSDSGSASRCGPDSFSSRQFRPEPRHRRTGHGNVAARDRRSTSG